MTASLDQLTSIAILVEVVRTRSFSVAAARLGVSKSMISDRIVRLEREIGVRLVHRSTRRVVPTDAGLSLYSACSPLLEATSNAAAAATTEASEPRGPLRVGLPVTFSQLHMGRLLPRFLDAHPKVSVEVAPLSADLIADGVDVQLRLGATRTPGVISRKVAVEELVTCATPQYVREQTTPGHPTELAQHRCLRCTELAVEDEWCFVVDGSVVSPRIGSALSAPDSRLLLEATLAGAGIARLPSALIERELRHGTLVEVLGEYRSPPLGIFAVYPERRHLAPKVRVFIDFVASAFQQRARP